MRKDINFKGADRESDFWLISILCPFKKGKLARRIDGGGIQLKSHSHRGPRPDVLGQYSYLKFHGTISRGLSTRYEYELQNLINHYLTTIF